MAATSLLTIRRALARALDDLGVHAVSSATGTSVTCATLSDLTANASTARYNGAYVYVATGSASVQQRRVTTGGYTPSTGALALELSWTPPAAADEIDVTHLFPCIGQVPGEDADYRSIINRALGKLLIADRVTLAITTADTYSTTTWPWLDRPERLVRVLEPAPVSGRAPVDASWRNPRLVVDGPAPFLQIDAPFSTATGNLTLEVMRPANTLVSGNESTVGLVSDAETVAIGLEDVLPAALEEAYAALTNRPPGQPSFPNAARLRDHWGAEARRSRFWDRTREMPAAPAPAAQGAAA